MKAYWAVFDVEFAGFQGDWINAGDRKAKLSFGCYSQLRFVPFPVHILQKYNKNKFRPFKNAGRMNASLISGFREL